MYSGFKNPFSWFSILYLCVATKTHFFKEYVTVFVFYKCCVKKRRLFCLKLVLVLATCDYCIDIEKLT